MFELVDSTPEGWISGRIPDGEEPAVLTETVATLAGALSRIRTAGWSGKLWKIYDSDGTVVRHWAGRS